MDLSKMIETQAASMNRAVSGGYTAAQYEERIARLVAVLEVSRGNVNSLCGSSRHCYGAWLEEIDSVLSTERAHRTAEAAGLAGESDVERARRLA